MELVSAVETNFSGAPVRPGEAAQGRPASARSSSTRAARTSASPRRSSSGWTSARPSSRGANFRSADLSKAILRRANLKPYSFRGDVRQRRRLRGAGRGRQLFPRRPLAWQLPAGEPEAGELLPRHGGFDADLSGIAPDRRQFPGARSWRTRTSASHGRSAADFTRARTLGGGPGELRLLRGEVQEDEVLGRDRAAGQVAEGRRDVALRSPRSSRRQRRRQIEVDDVKEEGAPEADRRPREEGGEAAAARLRKR